jgi:ABC-2 type transport system permease protein
MSAVASFAEQQSGSPRVHTGRVTMPHVLRSEWTKLWTLRSTRWSLLAAFIAMAGSAGRGCADVALESHEPARPADI